MKKVLFAADLPQQRQAEAAAIPGLSIVFQPSENVRQEDLPTFDAVLGNLPRPQLEQCTKLEWVQLATAGDDRYLWLPENITLCNASGAFGVAISEHMLGCVLMVQKNLAGYLLQQQSHSWHSLGMVKTLGESVVLSVGTGDIGTQFCQRMHALGATVYGVRRSEHEKPDWLDDLTTFAHLDEYLPKADIVALSLPATTETIHMFDARRLRLMKQSSILLNVGRGNAIVTDDLMTVVKEGRFAGVCLDVTDPEPLPRNHPLWNLPRVYITPHVSGGYHAALTKQKVLDIMIDNLRRYAGGQPLKNVVSRRQEY